MSESVDGLRSGRIMRSFVGAVATAAVVAGGMVALGHPAAAAPAFQLPFPCGQDWRLDTWAHSPALDMVREPDQHGTDGALLVAPAAGRVNQSFYHDNAGNMIQIDHGGGHFTTYIHLQSRAVGVGTQVRQGQTIGRVGRTGPTSNGHPHLHYEQAFDSNDDGRASWGYAGSERVAAVFNGVTYTGSGRTWRNVESKNSCAPQQPVDNGTVQFADINGDGRDEILSISDGNVRAYLNLGWDSPKTYDGPQSKLVATGFTDPVATKFADINGDGRDEILSISDGNVRAYLNLGWDSPKTYDGPQSKLVATGFTDPVATKFADINGDGRDEILSISGGDVRAYLNLGWDSPKTYDGPSSKLVAEGFSDPVATKFADINGDGRDEILSISGGDVRAYLNLGWDSPKTYDGPSSKLVAEGFSDPVATKFADINGDGRDEILSISDGNVRAYLNLGWDSPKTYDGPQSKLVALGFHI